KLLPTSYQFKKGHRIRIALTGADKDHFQNLDGPAHTRSAIPHPTTRSSLRVTNPNCWKSVCEKSCHLE
ncbi:MAG TPA: CocE/NonD family hydrolase C-terminal non-catalytic domain-containing protein, partial [Nitrospirales bacterium]|nr:CocE/NonD family hydrolase C-terminal non-catalytic domain-containing protein [Nitrospirales bacterium]